MSGKKHGLDSGERPCCLLHPGVCRQDVSGVRLLLKQALVLLLSTRSPGTLLGLLLVGHAPLYRVSCVVQPHAVLARCVIQACRLVLEPEPWELVESTVVELTKGCTKGEIHALESGTIQVRVRVYNARDVAPFQSLASAASLFPNLASCDVEVLPLQLGTDQRAAGSDGPAEKPPITEMDRLLAEMRKQFRGAS